jgi:hypothetical protein
VKSSRIDPIELGNEAKLVGTSPQLTPDLGWSTCEKIFFRPKKCPTPGSNLRPWACECEKRGFDSTLISLSIRLIRLIQAYCKAYQAGRAPTRAQRGGQVRKPVGSWWCNPDFGGQTCSESDPSGFEPIRAVRLFRPRGLEPTTLRPKTVGSNLGL